MVKRTSSRLLQHLESLRNMKGTKHLCYLLKHLFKKVGLNIKLKSYFMLLLANSKMSKFENSN